MAIALNNTFQDIRNRFVNGPAGQFFKWWSEELRNAMPSRLRARLQYARRRLLMQVNSDDISLSVDDAGAIQALDTFSSVQDLHLQQQQVRELLQQHELTETGRDLLLSEADVLRTEVVMPLATEGNLRQALAYEMDRHTPFQAEDVYFTWRVISRDREAGQLHFDLFVTPKGPLDAHIELLKRLGLAPAGVDVMSATGPTGVNLLPEALRYRIVNEKVRANWLLAAVAAALLAVIMTQSLWLREHQINEVEAAIEDVRAEALAVQQIRKQIEDASEAAGFMQSKKINNGSRVEMLAELTRLLPSDTFLDRLSMQEDTIQMQGKSDNAQSLIELINDSEFFSSASFRGPTRLDNRSGKEIFDLSVKITVQDAG